MCHQSIVTGSAFACDAGADAAVDGGGAADEADEATGLEPPLEQAANDDGCGRQKDRDPSTGSHWPKPPLGTGARHDAGAGPVGDDISSDAIICAAPVAAGPTHVRDPAPPGRRSLAGRNRRSASFVVADRFADNRSVAGLLLESCEAPVDSFGSATVGVAIRDLSIDSPNRAATAGRFVVLAETCARNFRRTVKFATLRA